MCGILGYLSNEQTCDERSDCLKILNNRGPDGSGIWREPKIMLGHTRLAIIDLSNDASQPMTWENGNVIVFNGEIYNYIEVRKALINKGYSFKTSSDTEVILAAYDCWGEQCANHFNGIWAFAVYDKQKNTIFCSRDRFGEKPFYYFIDHDRFVFASEIKAILPFLDGAKANIQAMVPFLARGFVNSTDETFFKNIFQLPPSNNLVFNIKEFKFKTNQYYKISPVENKIQNPAEEVLYAIKDSIGLRLRADVRVGACLSGGLDSSSIVALASQMYKTNEPFIAIHATSSLPESDESAYARSVAERLGMELHIVEPTYSDFCDSVDDIFYVQDEPFGSTSIFMQYFVMKKAKEIGCKVMLDGQGADEVFLGYESYLSNINKFFGKGNSFIDDAKLFRVTQQQIENDDTVNETLTGFIEKLVTVGNIKQNAIDANIISAYLNNYKNIFDFQISQLYSRSLPSLLRYEDRNSMRYGVEARLPYLDYRLVELVVNLPLQIKLQKGYLKYILREAIENDGTLGNDVVWRYNKMGFESPQKLWLEKYKKEMMETINSSLIIREIFDKVDIRRDDFLWKLFSIAKWEKVFNVGL